MDAMYVLVARGEGRWLLRVMTCLPGTKAFQDPAVLDIPSVSVAHNDDLLGLAPCQPPLDLSFLYPPGHTRGPVSDMLRWALPLYAMRGEGTLTHL